MYNAASFRVLPWAWVFLFLSQDISAQDDRAFVLCEGAQDFYSGEVLEAPRLGVVHMDADPMQFEVLRVFEGHAYVTDLILSVSGEEVYVAAEDTVYRLDASDGSVLASQPLQGARRLFHSGGRVFASRGDYDPETFGSVPFDEYLVALDAVDLSWQAGWSAEGGEGPGFASESMCLLGDVLHIGVNNAFAYGEEVGLVGRLDLLTGEYEEVDLGGDGLNPVHLLPVADGVVTVNARQYDGTSLSRVEPSGPVVTEVVADVTAGCGAAAVFGNEVVFQVYGEGGFRKVDGSTLVTSGSWPGNGYPVYSMAVRTAGDVLLGLTDFATYGGLELLNPEGEWMASVSTGIAPGVIRLASSTSGMVEVPVEVVEVVGRYDLLGRPADGHIGGPHVVVMSDGRARLEWRQAD